MHLPNLTDPIFDADRAMKDCAGMDDPQVPIDPEGCLHCHGGIRIVPIGLYNYGWGMAWYTSTLYNHAAPPNWVHTDCGVDGKANTPSKHAVITARGYHPGGVNALCGDGSVKFIKNSIQLSTWRALGTRSGGEVISGDAL
jgi:hypothetical protein